LFTKFSTKFTKKSAKFWINISDPAVVEEAVPVKGGGTDDRNGEAFTW
jgi:hypothetical protein